jgi:hypothetical protein
MTKDTTRRGRIEAGLDRDLATRHEIPPSERAALRAQARALDVAEERRDVDAVSRASAVYLQLRTAAGLSAAANTPDEYDRLLADVLRATPGTSDPAHD